MRRTSPATVSARRTSYTAWWDTAGSSLRTAARIEWVSACGCAWTAASTASRGRVTRRLAPRSMRSKSEAVATLRSLLHLLEPIKRPGEAAALGTTRVAAFNRPSECVDHGPRGRPHDLRHTVASLWIAAGVDIKTASAWRGHPTFGTAGAEEECRRTHSPLPQRGRG